MEQEQKQATESSQIFADSSLTCDNLNHSTIVDPFLSRNHGIIVDTITNTKS